jgi:hypothetical protein
VALEGTRRAVSRKGAGRLSPRALAVAEKRAEAARLRAVGATFQEIGRTLGVTTGRAHQLVDEALQSTVADSVDELRALTMARLEALLTGCYERAREGNLRALGGVLRIIDTQCKIMGLFAPVPGGRAAASPANADVPVSGQVQHAAAPLRIIL